VPNCRYADCLFIVRELVDDAVRADAQRVRTTEPSSECVAAVRIPFKQSERVLDSVKQRPLEFKQSFSSAARENDLGHDSAGSPTLGEFAT
jgi:hypothetical protein